MRVQETTVQLPPLDTYSDLPVFNTKAVVRQTNVPAPTLRAWERRYDILAPRRGENDYRLYSERDIATVSWLRERVGSGMTISQAIALLKALQPARRPARRGERAPHSVTSAPAPAEGAVAAATPPSRISLDELQGDLLRCLGQFDEAAARRVIALAVAVHPVEDVCLHLLAPVLHTVGQRWADGRLNCIVEHFSVALVRAQLESLFRESSDATDGPLVLVGCAPGELHELGPLMLALFLRRAGLRVAYLGQNVEAVSLIETVRAHAPAVVALSAALPRHVTALAALGEHIATLPRPRPLFVLGGQAFAPDSELAAQVVGTYPHNDPRELARELKTRLSL